MLLERTRQLEMKVLRLPGGVGKGIFGRSSTAVVSFPPCALDTPAGTVALSRQQGVSETQPNGRGLVMVECWV